MSKNNLLRHTLILFLKMFKTYHPFPKMSPYLALSFNCKKNILKQFHFTPWILIYFLESVMYTRISVKAQERSMDMIDEPRKDLQLEEEGGKGDRWQTHRNRLLPKWKKSCYTYFTPFRKGNILPLGILNLLSFLYHRQPCGVFTILTGYSVSGQSNAFNMKSVANKRKNNSFQ